MVRRCKVFMVLVLAVVLFSAPGFARAGKGRGGPRGMRAEFSEFLKRLNLSDKQVEKLRDMQDELRRKNRPIFDKLDSAMKRLEEVTLKESGPERDKKIKELIAQISRLRARMARNRLNYWVKFVELLSPDQRKVLYSWLEEVRGRFRRRSLKPGLFLPSGGR